MMTGMLRVKNEARWIERVLASILPICDRVLVMDDHSDDGTPLLCAKMPGVSVFDSPFTGLDEARDKNWLLDRARGDGSGWILALDGDEMLAPGAAQTLLHAAQHSGARCLAPRIRYLWDREDRVRVDGVYGRFRRPSAFIPGRARFAGTGAGGNFHCGNVPLSLQSSARPVDADILHFGYLHREDRVRKYGWYNRHDGRNGNEDGYRHMVIGDLFPAESRFRWGGPLEVRPLSKDNPTC